MQKRVLYFLAALIAGSSLASAAFAKVWLLPDYQQKQFYSHRTNNPNDNGNVPNPGGGNSIDCANYGMISASQVASGMVCKSSSRIKDTICYSNCACPSQYQYTSSNCSTANGKALAGSACQGKYTQCVCSSTKYPYTSTTCRFNLGGESCNDGTAHYTECIDPCDNPSAVETSSCSYGCETPVEGCATKCLKCAADSCKMPDISSLPNVSECGYKCKTQAVGCTTKCKECYADSCNWPENASYPAKSSCDYGCQTDLVGCTTKCKQCKTCVPCSAEYLATCPAGTICEDRCTGCDGVAKVKPTGCATNYADYNTYWCGMTPATTNCATLGYSRNAMCQAGTTQILCPFDASYSVCVGVPKSAIII